MTVKQTKDFRFLGDNLASVIDARFPLPEAIRAGILARAYGG